MPHRRPLYLVRYWFRLVKAQIVFPERTRYWGATTRLILSRLDPVTIRVLLGGSSFAWAFAALPYPFMHNDPFERHGFEILRSFAPAWCWATAFVIHGLGVAWRLYDRAERPGWHLFINCYGFALWFTTTASINLALSTFTPTTGMEWIMVVASAWALVLTGKRKEIVSL